jgi:aspartyl-tRNA synthetase
MAEIQLEALGDLRRTHWCGELRSTDVGRPVVLFGWAHRVRDMGGLIFIDLRDREGIVQCVVNPASAPQSFEVAKMVRGEFVLAVEGRLQRRAEGTVNPNLPTGEVEVLVERLHILNTCRPLPMPVADDQPVDEALRMQYRYLDLRRPAMARRLVLRHRLAKAMRDYLDGQGFLEIETPVLVRSTPEGARDYLVPSRVRPGTFYALPQSPQLFKQLLMVGGVDRYFQIARCFRDEDLRADRQPEFTQVDLEMSFVRQEDIFEVVEGLLHHTFSTVMHLELPRPFRRLPYREAIERWGSDKPDLRFGMELTDVAQEVAEVDFTIFRTALDQGGRIKALAIPGQAGASRKDQDQMSELAKGVGLPGFLFISWPQEGLKSSLAKFMGPETLEAVARRAGAGPGDLVALAAGPADKVHTALGRLRLDQARRLGLIPQGRYEFLWVVDFPLFAWDEETGGWTPEHHPFCSPHPEDLPYLESDPGRVRAAAYDLVLNGNEVASGSIRIHQRPLQEKVFACIGLGPEEARRKFGFLLEAFELGAPPHGGIALGFDRLTAICAGVESIRDVIAFPKNASAACPLTGAPVPVDPQQLELLKIKVLTGNGPAG